MVIYMCIASVTVAALLELLLLVGAKASAAASNTSSTSGNCTDFSCGNLIVLEKALPNIRVTRGDTGCSEQLQGGPAGDSQNLSLFCSHQKLFLVVNNTGGSMTNYTVLEINYNSRTIVIDLGHAFDNCSTPFDWTDAFLPHFFPSNTLLLRCNSSLPAACHCLSYTQDSNCGRRAGTSAACAAVPSGPPAPAGSFCCNLQPPLNAGGYGDSVLYNSCTICGSEMTLSGANSSSNIDDLDLANFTLQWRSRPGPGSTTPPTMAPTMPPASNGSNSTQQTLNITGGVLGSLLGVVLAVSLFVCFCRRSGKMKISKTNSGQMPLAKGYSMDLSSSEAGPGTMTHLFSYKELDDATQGFSAAVELGGGGFGTVYKGKLADSRLVAVKKLNQEGRQGLQQFHNEVTVLSHVHHPHLVHLLGWCVEAKKRHALLVYEFVSNGSLAQHLHGGPGSCLLLWETRLNIAIQIADALMYLHCLVEPPIFHRDVKTTNILLDAQFRAKVADFGLSRLVPTSMFEMTHISTAPQGTPGYLDPDYHQSYQLSDKSDVYSFGVVLMELITAKKAVDMTRERKEINLASLAVAKIQAGTLDEIIDPYLKMMRFNEDGGYSRTNVHAPGDAEKLREMVNHMAELAFRCLATEKDDRPNMKEVLEELRSIRVHGYTADPTNIAAHDASGNTWVHSSSMNEGEYIELDLSSYGSSLNKDTKPLIKSEDQQNSRSWPHSPSSAEADTTAWVKNLESSSNHSITQMWHEINLTNPQAR